MHVITLKKGNATVKKYNRALILVGAKYIRKYNSSTFNAHYCVMK